MAKNVVMNFDILIIQSVSRRFLVKKRLNEYNRMRKQAQRLVLKRRPVMAREMSISRSEKTLNSGPAAKKRAEQIPDSQ